MALTQQNCGKQRVRPKPGEVKYNQGELHNLKVNRGTLNEEERFMINDHIIQTFTSVKQAPYPPYLQNIPPEIASGHHERIDGKGYPRGLKGTKTS
ncbi:hypothetical protein OH492_16450 [Vibrio chagasii]|nr:hypothetical protein [Vibrio chagasii]